MEACTLTPGGNLRDKVHCVILWKSTQLDSRHDGFSGLRLPGCPASRAAAVVQELHRSKSLLSPHHVALSPISSVVGMSHVGSRQEVLQHRDHGLLLVRQLLLAEAAHHDAALQPDGFSQEARCASVAFPPLCLLVREHLAHGVTG